MRFSARMPADKKVSVTVTGMCRSKRGRAFRVNHKPSLRYRSRQPAFCWCIDSAMGMSSAAKMQRYRERQRADQIVLMVCTDRSAVIDTSITAHVLSPSPSDGQGTRPHRFPADPADSRRGDRIGPNVRFWPKADIGKPTC
jgi:hypothetical protein